MRFSEIFRRAGSFAAKAIIAAVLVFTASSAKAGFHIEKDITFDKHGGVELRGDMYIPDGKGPFPVILFFHGGGFIGGVKNNHSQDRLYSYYAERGYALFTAEYRLFKQGGFFPNNVRDGKCALAWLKNNGAKYGADVSRMAIMGESAGGYMASMVALAPNDDYFLPDCGSAKGVDMSVKAAVIYYAPFDFVTLKSGFAPVMEIELRRSLGLKNKKATNEYKAKNSPVNYAASSPPMLIINTEIDTTVDPAQSNEMTDALKKAGVTVEHLVEKGEGMEHGFPLTAFDSPQANEARERGLEFLDRYLKK